MLSLCRCKSVTYKLLASISWCLRYDSCFSNMRIGMLCIGTLNTPMADHLLHTSPFNDLKLRAQHHHPQTKAALLKFRRLVRAFVSKHLGRAAVALGGATAMLLGLLSDKAAAVELRVRKVIKRKKRGRDNKDPPSSSICGGCVEMRLDLMIPPAWSPSPWPETTVSMEMELLEAGIYCSYYDPSWNTVIPAELQLLPISGYLEWPDEEREMEEYGEDGGGEEEDGGGCNEIDSLAERFIARCHERFMLEKQESYRRHQEMLARSL